jgi:hydroxymethylbilane synthase
LQLRAQARGSDAAPEQLGIAVAEDLLRQGAAQILERVYQENQ